MFMRNVSTRLKPLRSNLIQLRRLSLPLFAFGLALTLGQDARAQVYRSFDYPDAAQTDSGEGGKINNNGDIVGDYTASDGTHHGFLLAEGRFSSIDYPGAVWTQAIGINNRCDDNRADETRGDENQCEDNHGDNNHGHNNQGDIVGFYFSEDGVVHGFLFSKGDFTSIDFPGAAGTNAWGINDNREITGGYTDDGADGKTHGYVRSKEGDFSSFDPPVENRYNYGRGINNAGDIAGIYRIAGQTDVTHGYVRIAGSFSLIDFPDAVNTNVPAINNQGDIVGNYSAEDRVNHGYLLSKGEFTSFDFPAAVRTKATGINDKGEITGNYIDADGRSHGYWRGPAEEESNQKKAHDH